MCLRSLTGSKARHTLSIETFVAAPAELGRMFAERLVGAASRAQADRRALSLVLPGGSVARAFLPALADARIDWSLVDLFWGDERAVAPDHPESNFRVADELLLRRASIDAARVHRMPADVVPLEAGAHAYDAELVHVLGEPPTFDVVLLGVGPDGHVCSLFPGHAALREASRRVVAIADSPKPPRERLTLTLPALGGADIYIAAFGASKADVMLEALANPASRLPVALAARAGKSALFMLDAEAAGRV
jgi:6-phosphogluconolactonase